MAPRYRRIQASRPGIWGSYHLLTSVFQLSNSVKFKNSMLYNQLMKYTDLKLYVNNSRKLIFANHSRYKMFNLYYKINQLEGKKLTCTKEMLKLLLWQKE